MIFYSTDLIDCFVIEPKIFIDDRGYFYESFHLEKFKQSTGINVNFLQDNIAKSSYGVVRGLHLQRNEFCQAKLIQVYQGKILDVAVDVRKKSPTFGMSFSVELTEENKKQLFVPRGFLHGYSVLSETAVVGYKCDNFYHKSAEDGVFPLDKNLNIDWKLPTEDIILSDKDKIALNFSDFLPFDF